MRAFVAFDIPQPVKDYLNKLTFELSKRLDGVRWVRSENQHLTIKFLGDIDESLIEKIISAINNITETTSAFKVGFKGLEGFPNCHMARVIVITLSQGVEELKRIFHLLEKELARLGFSKEDREFIPHITLGRRKNPKPLREIIQIEPLEFIVEDLVFYKSTLTKLGPIYEPIWKLKLKERSW
ncbi:MAG: RNA 2',3'-cyclic phosphodiesterase [Deltaproteobacteria bacterium]|nr:RNA 2',3'-cyclic phosphodiesterase [Deltaproteobacteria bacterium]